MRRIALTAVVTVVFAGGADRPTQQDSQNLTVALGGGVTMELVRIRPGTFLMGSSSAKSYLDEKPVHEVTITKPFYMGKYPVTQEQWQAVMGENRSNFQAPKNPVEQVSWNDCQKFLEKLSAKAPGRKFALPTEAQREYACRAGSQTDFYYGDDEGRFGEHGWFWDNSEMTTHPVGQKKPNAWGLYDMHGNVWEWCSDWKGDYTRAAVSDPKGPPSGNVRVLRGGAWGSSPRDCRSASRGGLDPAYRFILDGFRVICSADSQ